MSSSEELMNAAQPIVKTAMAPPTPPMTPPMAPPTPPMAPPSPMTPPMAPPSPMVPPPVPPMPPTPTPMGGDKEQGFFIGGAINAARAAAPVVGQVARTAKDKIVNITGSPKEFLKGLFAKNNETLNNAVLNKYGTLPAALTAGTTKINEATSSIQNSKNPEDTKKAITEAVDAPNTKEGLEETLQYVTGEPAPKNLSIDELNKTYSPCFISEHNQRWTRKTILGNSSDPSDNPAETFFQTIDKDLAAPWLLAATAVRTFAFVPENIPRYPARADDTAPQRKAKAVFTPRGETRMAIINTAENKPSILYSRCIKTIAPR